MGTEGQKNEKSSTPRKSKVVSSKKKDPKESLEYWTAEKMESAKPIPLRQKKNPPNAEDASQ